mgnify:CR=1 FL=1
MLCPSSTAYTASEATRGQPTSMNLRPLSLSSPRAATRQRCVRRTTAHAQPLAFHEPGRPGASTAGAVVASASASVSFVPSSCICVLGRHSRYNCYCARPSIVSLTKNARITQCQNGTDICTGQRGTSTSSFTTKMRCL